MGNAIEHFILFSYFGAICWIIFGVLMIRFITKNPAEDKYSQGGDMKGWVAGLGGIAFGVFIIIMKILGKF
jgi:membrane protein DedA with SNARE-associated domain